MGTGIEYLTDTWNPIAMRCIPISAGCDNCWHRRMANRLAGVEHFSGEVRAAYRGEAAPVLISERLEQPLRWRKLRVVGVHLTGDLFGENVPDEYAAAVFEPMNNFGTSDADIRQHRFLVFTKRPRSMQNFMERLRWYTVHDPGRPARATLDGDGAQYKLPNVFRGVSVEVHIPRYVVHVFRSSSSSILI